MTKAAARAVSAMMGEAMRNLPRPTIASSTAPETKAARAESSQPPPIEAICATSVHSTNGCAAKNQAYPLQTKSPRKCSTQTTAIGNTTANGQRGRAAVPPRRRMSSASTTVQPARYMASSGMPSSVMWRIHHSWARKTTRKGTAVPTTSSRLRGAMRAAAPSNAGQTNTSGQPATNCSESGNDSAKASAESVASSAAINRPRA